MSKTFYKALGKTQQWPNVDNVIPSSLTYDDVLLVPQDSDIKSRSEVDTTVRFGPYVLKKPIVPSPMDTLTGEKMVREFARLGALGTLPRGEIFLNSKICKKMSNDDIPCIYAVGLKNGFNEAKSLVNSGAKVILVDVAHGAMLQAKELAREIKKKLKVFVVAGNIATYEQANEYKKYGIDIAKVGIGPGGLCITRLVTGSGFPQLSAVFETTSSGIPVVADGGIKKSGDFAKAIAAGATAIMCGSIFMGTDETPGEIKDGMKRARGQASLEYMKDTGVKSGEFRSAEGISIEVPIKGPVENVINDLMGGLRSAMTYSGARNIEEFQKKAIFSMVSPSVANESIPWLSEM